MSTEARVDRLIERCGYGAAALTIIPIPGSEIIGVMPLHVGMIIGIADEYGRKLTRESAVELVAHIGATVGVSLVGSKLATTAGKILLPGLGGLIAAPFMYAATLGIGHVAKLYFERGRLDEREMKRAYESAVKHAKRTFDPSRARSKEARNMAEGAAREGKAVEPDTPSTGAADEPASVDDLAERLSKVEALFEKGHITEAEYERRREQILDEI